MDRRIALFKTIQNQQRLHRLSLPPCPDPIKIELLNGRVMEGKKWNTTPLDIAKEISRSLVSNALIAKVNGVLWDLLRPLEGDCKLEFFPFDSDEGRDTFWHSSAHILGESLERTYGCKLCIGPCTTRREGFYYDAFYGDLGLNENHFRGIEAEAAKTVLEKQPFERIEVSRQQALDMFSDNRFKVEIINDLGEDKTITVYRCGSLVDLCRGPHIPNTSFIKALACTKASSAYWRGDKDRERLQRVYGISYPDKNRLKEHLVMHEAKKYYHRELARNQEPFFSHRLSPGSFLPHGARVCNKLLEFIQSQYRMRGYEESDAHIFCKESQIKNEVKGVLDFISYVYMIFGFTFDLKLSTRPEKYLGDIETWRKAEGALSEALNELGKPWEINEGAGAFYGPKIDVSVSDAMKRKFRCATLQLDFQLPQRFNLSYLTEDESKRERPVMLHRAILGSVERMFAILLEHFKGKWPFWLSPRQAMVCPVSEKSQSYAFELRERIHDAGYYVDVDTSDTTINKKVREAQLAQYNSIVVVGEAEASSGQVSVRVRDKLDHQVMTVDDLLADFEDMVASFQ